MSLKGTNAIASGVSRRIVSKFWASLKGTNDFTQIRPFQGQMGLGQSVVGMLPTLFHSAPLGTRSDARFI